MKTFVEWWGVFHRDNIVGVDQEGVDVDYRTLSDTQIQQLINNGMSEYIDRTFREFVQWMQIGDFVLIGTGQMTVFNLAGVAKVTGDYRFDPTRQVGPRHIRDVQFRAIPSTPVPMQRFARTSRLELIHETDFHDAILSLVR
jgi:predicted Mrr-cat superfamily restriction endonuclease